MLDGIGEGAYWSWMSGGGRPEGVLVVWRGRTLVNVNAIVAGSRQQEEIIKLSADLALKMLDRLPPRFVVGPPQAINQAPSATPFPPPTSGFSPPTFTSQPPPSATVAPPTFTPKPAPPPATTQAPVKPGVYALSLRADPPQPHNGQGVIFYVTFLNSTGADQYFGWCVESFRSDGKSHGITACKPTRTIPAGKNELATTDPYVGQKVGGCLALHARVIFEDSAKRPDPIYAA